MGIYRTVSEIDGDFSRKSQYFRTHPVYFAPPLKGVLPGIGHLRWGQKTRMMELPG